MCALYPRVRVLRDRKTPFPPPERTVVVCWRTEASEWKVIIHRTGVVTETGLREHGVDTIKEDFPEAGVLLRVLSKAHLLEGTEQGKLKLSSKWLGAWEGAIFLE